VLGVSRDNRRRDAAAMPDDDLGCHDPLSAHAKRLGARDPRRREAVTRIRDEIHRRLTELEKREAWASES